MGYGEGRVTKVNLCEKGRASIRYNKSSRRKKFK